ILGMVERNGKLNAKTIKDTSANTLTKEIIKSIKTTAMLNTDEWLGYNGLSKIYNKG
ncbi:transposase, partial [bacterium]|nr:transposase [bacterium]